MGASRGKYESFTETREVSRVDVDEITPLLSGEGHHAAVDHVNKGGSSSSVDPERREDPWPEEGGQMDGKSVASVIAVLLIGVFISQADLCLVLATYGEISSEFHRLQDGDWLLSSYMLAQCVAQPLYGKLSDIFGRKRCLQVSYGLFATGTLISGLGRSMPQVIFGRVIEGTGGAGMVCMVSILLTDLVPLHKVAIYRSYVNIVQTAGRSCGGVIGGYIAQTIGWRWAFLGQTPIVITAIPLVQWKLRTPVSKQQAGTEDTLSLSDKVKRIDFLGAATMSLAILSALIVLDMGGQKLPWTHPIIWIALGATALSTISFVLAEKYVAVEPIFPLRLLGHYVVITSYMMLCLQMVAVTAMMMIVPMYFQVTKLVDTGEAGAYLVPSVAGNTLGGLLTGAWIQRSLRYKMPQIIGSFFSMAAFAALVLVWRGHTTFLESLLIFPVGLATGVAHSATFIGLGAGVEEEDIAIAGSGLYLSSNVGSVAGVSLGNAIYQSTLRRGLNRALEGSPYKEDIIRKASEDISYIRKVSSDIRKIMLPAYVSSFQGVFILGMACSALALVVGLVSRETKLRLK